MSFDAAVETLRSGVTELFAPYAVGGRGELAFYPARLRNPILEAGAGRKLVAQEYFYVWDRTGGRSGPGIKSLFNYKIQSLDVLEETFEPRCEVTLSKAGDSSQGGYFARTNGRRTSASRTRTRRSRTRIGPTYVVQCGFCGKQFVRTTRSTRMNQHKNPWGSPCAGRVGFLVSIR
jgi:hypothetical protein